MSTVDFFTNCWERDYRQVLGEGFMVRKAEQFQFPFRKVCVTVNNVDDPANAKRLSDRALQRGEVDAVYFVQDELPSALRICGLRSSNLGKVRHFTDFYLVIVTCTDADYVVNCAADIDLDRPFDWITAAIDAMEGNGSYIVANPCWGWDLGGAAREAIYRDGLHCVSLAFSDACFLGKRGVFARPIYSHRHPAGKRYPLSAVGEVFEQRVDAYMRTNGYYRITDTRVSYNHHGALGASYPRPSLLQRAARRLARHFGGIASGERKD